MTIWMEVDLKNKELPTGRMAESAAELSRLCGLCPTAVACAMWRARSHNRKCKYVRVEINETDDENDCVEAR